MTLKYHESVNGILTPELLLCFDIMEVEKVPAGEWPWIFYMTGQKSAPIH